MRLHILFERHFQCNTSENGERDFKVLQKLIREEGQEGKVRQGKGWQGKRKIVH